ncbi:hypothetical protein GCM10008018_19350 [Paenibacillus marchantiophytorum]|uniref:Uncharacterized protein n=1 Tax=Paenibacillus marchantiophytorum TaxID=1619310 RepID=A0ABQ2BSX4_9BACL|nr:MULTISPECIES: hypothetical protein [Paenibacillus]UKS25301.1 hypothetical protein LOZ80_27430 [Paenibacillus sp. HWE-109]GGI46893.1 hypothetical protein GCM10008018_19350 [Paenibacillus marchantiophytorum]
MASNQRLVTDADFQEAVDRQAPVRVFKDDHIVDSNAVVLRFSDKTIVVQTRVSDLTYYDRDACEFFEMKRR